MKRKGKLETGLSSHGKKEPDGNLENEQREDSTKRSKKTTEDDLQSSEKEHLSTQNSIPS